MTDIADEPADLETLAALYALGHLQGEERAAFEAVLQDTQGPAAAYLRQFQEVAAGLSWGACKQPPPTLRSRLLERIHRKERPRGLGRIDLGSGRLLVLAAQLGWKETGVPGIRCKLLFVDSQQRYASSLVSMAPGTAYPRHRHAQVEELFMLAGDIQVGGYRLQPGDYCRAEAGTLHEAIHTETGCTFIALASLDNEFLPPAADTGPVEPPPAAPSANQPLSGE